jgi:hypothetical protein
MRANLICVEVAAAAMMALAPCEARACGQGSSYGPLTYGPVAAVVAIDGVLSMWDLVTVSGLAPPSVTYGTVELLLAFPQLVIGIVGMSEGGSSFFTDYTLWMVALAAHGVWSIAAATAAQRAPGMPVPDPNPPPDPPGGTKMMFGPTYVPLGQLSQVGFGLSGRF